MEKINFLYATLCMRPKICRLWKGRDIKMRFWIATLLLSLMLPFSMSIIGFLYLRKPSKTINWMRGYRSKRSIRNQETWEFAQRHFGGVCCRWGIVMVLFIVILMLSVFGSSEKIIEIVGAVIGTAEGFIMVYLLTPTERALKKKFGV